MKQIFSPLVSPTAKITSPSMIFQINPIVSPHASLNEQKKAHCTLNSQECETQQLLDNSLTPIELDSNLPTATATPRTGK